jgi:2-oxo-3-hexenedioate decarboxylase
VKVGNRAERTRRIAAIAGEALAILGTGRQVPSFQSRFPGFDVEEAYEVAARVRELRGARGERAIGRKIGFTNPAVQKAFGVSAPIWNSMFDTTVRDIAAMESFVLSGLPEPLIEPEIAFHLAAAPRADMTEDELLACVDWVAHGCEIVQSIFPNWRLTAADSIAAYGLHGAYLIGEKQPIADNRRAWKDALSDFTLELSREDEVVRRGHASNVLGGPLKALRFLVEELASSPLHEPLEAGEIVTTGTLTDAMPVAGGETWSTRLDGIPLKAVRVRFVQERRARSL